jgi:DNA modification methylase
MGLRGALTEIIAAAYLERDVLGYEIDEKYYNMIEKRIKQELTPTLFQ